MEVLNGNDQEKVKDSLHFWALMSIEKYFKILETTTKVLLRLETSNFIKLFAPRREKCQKPNDLYETLKIAQ